MKRLLAILCTLALMLSVLSPAVFAAENSSLQAAKDDDSSEIIVLEEDASNLTVDRDTTIDLNGYSIDGVTVTGGTLYCLDSQTADYTVADGIYGHVTGVTGAVKAAEGYLQVGDSFHAVNLDIYAMTLRASDVGVYYKSNFAADEVVAAQVESFGVALSVVTAPNADNLDSYCGYSVFEGFEAGEGANATGTSTLLKGIMKAANGDKKNAKNAAMPIYGRAYIKTAEGYVFGETVKRSLQEQVEAIDGVWASLKDSQKAPVLGMLESYTAVIEGWNIPNIRGIQVPGADEEIQIPVNVTAENGIVTEAVTVEQDGVSVTVPAGTQLAEGATALTLTVTPVEAEDTGLTLKDDRVLIPMDVHVEGLAADNAQPLTIYLGKIMPENLNMGNYTVYHVENGNANEMTLIPVDAEFTAHNQYKYSLDGELTLYMASFSVVAAEVDANNAWNGTRDYSWYNTADTTLYIRNADQLAGFGTIVGGMDGQTADDFANRIVVLTADISIGDAVADNGKVFYPIGYYNDYGGYTRVSGVAVNSWFKPFRGTFDGNGNTISDFYQNTWEMFGDYNDGYSGTPNYYREGMGLFGKVYGGTVRNLNVRNFSCDSEHGTSGTIASYADCGATFENIAIFDCNPRVYNIGNGGIVGCAGWYATETADEKVTFRNITVDNSNKISALWDASGTSAGGILGQYYPNSGQSAYNYPKNPGVHFENCRISAILEVNNDCISNYHYYWYRYTGMLMGSVRANKIVDGYTMADTTDITAEDCEVSYGYWNEFWYCELVKNSIASYTHDYQFGRLTSITDVKQIQDENGNWNQEGNFALLDENRNCKDCYHIFKNSEGELYRHFHNVADETNPNIYESFDLNGDGELNDLKEDRQRYLLPFNQILTGDGMGILAHREFEGVTIVKKDEAGIRSSQEKFAAADNICLVNGELKLSDIFAVKDDATISVGSVQAYISPVGEDSTVKPAACVISNGDWENGILKIEGYGAAKITITDYWYCTPTVVNVSIGERLPVQKFEAADNFRDDATYPIQSAIKLSDLFKAVSGLATNQSIQSSGVQVTVAPADENSTVSGTFVQGDTWEQGTVTFTGEGKATVTITDMDACLATTLNVIINPYTADLYFEDIKKAFCPVCNEKVTWTAFVPGTASQGLTGHYYLTDDVTFTGTDAAGIFYSSTKNKTLCFHLNGHDLTATKTRAIFGSSGKLNVMGNGTVTGTNTSAEIGSAVQTNNTVAGNTVRLYGGTYKRASNSKGAVIGTQACGEIYVYEGATLDAPGSKAVIQRAPTYSRNSFVGLFGCTVNGDIINKGSGSYKSTLEIVDATVNGTVQLAESNLFVGGAAKITGIDMGSEIRLQAGQLTDGASIGIVNSGIFMDKGEHNAAYAKYFKGMSPADRITLKDGALHCGRDYLSDLQFEEGTTNAMCPVCGEIKTWTPVDGSAPIVNGKVTSHYYLANDIEFTAENGELSFFDPTHGTHTVCIHLNGHSFTGTNARFIYGSTCVTNIMGSGTVTGNRSDKYPYGSTVQINVANPNGTVNLYGGTWTQGETGTYSKDDYVISISNNGSNINIYEDARIVANSGGKAVYIGMSNMVASSMIIRGTVEGDVFVAAPAKTFPTSLTLDGCNISGTVTMGANTNLTISHAAKVQLLDIPESVLATLENMTQGAKITVKNEGIFSKANTNAAQYAKYFEAQSRGDKIIVQDDQLRCKTDYEAKLYVDETGIAYCPVCKKDVQWTAVSSGEEGIVAVNGGHYYLAADIVYEKPYDSNTNTAFFNGVPVKNTSACLHLNGHNLTATKTHGIFGGWGLTNIMGEGVVSGYASSTATSSAVQINNSVAGSGVHLYSGTYRSQADSKSQYVAGISGVGGGLYIYEDADIASTTGKAIRVGQSGYRDSNLEIYGATIVGDIDTTVPEALMDGVVANAKLVLKDTTVNGTVDLKLGNDLTLEGLTQITKLQIAEGQIVNFVDLKPGSSIAVAASGIFSGVMEQADAWLEYITCATPGDWINVRDNQFCQSIKTTIPTASAEDQAALNATYAGTAVRYGEMHNHTNSGPLRDDGTGTSYSTGADGRNSLTEWIAEMDRLKMDFAFIVDHGQSIHMYKENFPNWREDYFIGGTEPGTTITDSKASQAKPHYNMLFADAASLESIFFKYEDKYKPIQWTAENYPTAQNPYDYGYRVKYPTFTTAEFAQLAKDVYAAGGLLVQVHPKYDSYIYSDDPMDYYFADYTGFEITTGSGGNMMYKDNNEAYETWVDLLNMGKKIWATAGSDRHRLPDISGMTVMYTKTDDSADYMETVRQGNMAPGWVGIRMNVGTTAMGGETDFTGKRLQFSVGDIYNSGEKDYVNTPDPYVEGHTYRVELYDDGGLLMAANIDPLQMNYFAIDCDETARFYRVVVWDVTDQERIGVSNPIWNTAE